MHPLGSLAGQSGQQGRARVVLSELMDIVDDQNEIARARRANGFCDG